MMIDSRIDMSKDSRNVDLCFNTLCAVFLLFTLYLGIYVYSSNFYEYPEHTVEKNMTFSSINVVPNRIFHKDPIKKVFHERNASS